MKFFSLISEKKVVTNKKIIPAEEFSKLKSGAEILKEVKKEAVQYRQTVAKECEIIKEEAAKDGYQKGLTDFNTKIIKLDEKLAAVEEEVKKTILQVALKAAKKIVGEELKLHPDRIIDIVIQSLKPVLQHHRVIIYANRDDVETLEKHKAKIKEILEQVKSFSIQERADIEKGGCIIETEAGIINAQLENQWRALETAFDKLMKS